MENQNIGEKIIGLLPMILMYHAPVLSGNTKYRGIGRPQLQPDGSYQLVISAPMYDLDEWRRLGSKINQNIFTRPGNYANSVNLYGGFGSHNASMHWVNRACYDTVVAVAGQIGAEVINELPLNAGSYVVVNGRRVQDFGKKKKKGK